jgi:L-cysteine S-thiosulfotransferase
MQGFSLSRSCAAVLACTAAFLFLSAAVHAQQNSAVEDINKYRAQLADGNPAELWEARGEDIWRSKRGPKQASLQACDLGLGPGVVKGAYTQLPKYFADTDKVQDLESRLITCITTLQGIAEADVKKNPFGAGNDKKSDMEALAAFVTSESRGMKMKVSVAHPKEQAAFEIGKRVFFHRGGPHDFSCASCHSEPNLRIRLQELPNLTKLEDAQRAYGAWPAYRVSQGEVRSMQHRLWDCFRQQRFPEPEYAGDLITALTMFLAKSAEGGVYNAPAIKR